MKGFTYTEIVSVKINENTSTVNERTIMRMQDKQIKNFLIFKPCVQPIKKDDVAYIYVVISVTVY